MNVKKLSVLVLRINCVKLISDKIKKKLWRKMIQVLKTLTGNKSALFLVLQQQK